MNYMINNEASKQVAIAFAKWTIITGMWNSDLTFDEQYECWMKVMDESATDEIGDDFERQLEYMSGAYED